MTVDSEFETLWHKDGHRIHLQINRNELSVLMVSCPGHDDRACQMGRFHCAVQWFLDRFGLDCNVGVCDAASEIEVAWTIQGDPNDPDLCQVWVIPVTDLAFSAWLEAQEGE